MRVSDLDLDHRTVRIHESLVEVEGRFMRQSTKTANSRRTLVLPETVAEAIAKHLANRGQPQGDELLFPARGGQPLHAANFRRRVWAPACDRAELPGLRFHALRHSAAAIQLGIGVSLFEVSRGLGHGSIRTTGNVYGHLLPAGERATAEALDRELQRAQSISKS
jgi:integrase